MKTVTLIFVSFLFLLSSCGKKDTALSSGAPSELEGTWSTGCADSVVRTVTFSGGQFLIIDKVYGDTGCTQLTATVQAGGGFTLGASVAQPEGARKIDVILGSLLGTPETADEANMMNALHSCGLTTWTAGQTENVYGKCLLSTGFVAFGDFKSDGHQLVFGKSGPLGSATDASADDKRPTEWSPYSYSRQ